MFFPIVFLLHTEVYWEEEVDEEEDEEEDQEDEEDEEDEDRPRE